MCPSEPSSTMLFTIPNPQTWDTWECFFWAESSLWISGISHYLLQHASFLLHVTWNRPRDQSLLWFVHVSTSNISAKIPSPYIIHRSDPIISHNSSLQAAMFKPLTVLRVSRSGNANGPQLRLTRFKPSALQVSCVVVPWNAIVFSYMFFISGWWFGILEHELYVSIQLGMSSSHLTNSFFREVGSTTNQISSRWLYQCWSKYKSTCVIWLKHAFAPSPSHHKRTLHWLVVWNKFYVSLCSHILGIIIPTDFHIFQRDSSTTNQIMWV